MFGFFKKKEPQQSEQTATVLSAQASEQLKTEIEQIQQAISTTQAEQQLAELFEQLGLKYAALNEIDQAIHYLEKSLAAAKNIGAGYKKLLSLYNQKRAAAARAGDDQGIDYYMSKLDDMRQIAKQGTISGNK